MSIIENKTPYIGKIRLKFEKHPHYTGGGKNFNTLNTIHLDLGFTKLVSRVYPKRDKNGDIIINPIKKSLIELSTLGFIRDYTMPKLDCDNEVIVLKNSFVSFDGDYIGDIEKGWWYYKNNFLVCDEYPCGVSVKLFKPIQEYYVSEKKSYYKEVLKQQISIKNVEGFYGYSHRGGNTFKIGDKIFEESYTPVETDFEEWEWAGFLEKAEQDKDSELIDYIPFNQRGSKTIVTWKDAFKAAKNLSKYLG